MPDPSYYQNAANHPDSRAHAGPNSYDSECNDWNRNQGVEVGDISLALGALIRLMNGIGQPGNPNKTSHRIS